MSLFRSVQTIRQCRYDTANDKAKTQIQTTQGGVLNGQSFNIPHVSYLNLFFFCYCLERDFTKNIYIIKLSVQLVYAAKQSYTQTLCTDPKTIYTRNSSGNAQSIKSSLATFLKRTTHFEQLKYKRICGKKLPLFVLCLLRHIYNIHCKKPAGHASLCLFQFQLYQNLLMALKDLSFIFFL